MLGKQGLYAGFTALLAIILSKYNSDADLISVRGWGVRVIWSVYVAGE